MPPVVEPGEPALGLGLADGDAQTLGSRVLAAWDAFVDLAQRSDLAAPSRLPGWTGADVCIHLGGWPDSRPLHRVLASARAGGIGSVPRPDEENAALLATHRGASDAEVLGALQRARDTLRSFLASAEVAELGRLPSVSAVGPLPVLTLVHAGCYELAVHALDLAPCGAPPPAPELLDAGLAALVDVTGALASRHGLRIGVTAQPPGGGWRFAAAPAGWSTTRVGSGPVSGAAVFGRVEDLLDASAGRAAIVSLLVSRRLRVQSLPSFLRLAPLVEQAPGLPGAGALRAAIGSLSGINRLAARLPLPGRRH